MNFAILTGRMVKEVNVSDNRKSATGIIACDRDYPYNKDKNGNKASDFFTLRFLGEKNVSRAEKYLTKGVKIMVRAIPCRDTWKEGEEYKEFNYFIVQSWEFCESKNAKSEDAPTDNASSDTSFMDVPDGLDAELPFS